MVTAYSYVRWSSDKQTQGDSKRRQDTGAAKYAVEHGLALSSITYTDAGISAFKGLNAAEGALRAFLDAVNAGKIPKGSVLIVESLDRLSRLPPLRALALFQEIVDAGIEIVTLSDRQRYSKAGIDANWTSLIMALASMARGHEESKVKSDRVRAAWDAKRKSGNILTAICPPWLELSPDRLKWLVIKEQADKVLQVFKLCVQGHGAPAIANLLNTAEPRVKALVGSANNDEWSPGTVAHVLRNRAVIGCYTPKGELERDNYYEPIITKNVWAKAQAAITARRWTGAGPTSAKVSNLFTGFAYCGCCKARGLDVRMKYVSSKPPHIYLRCTKAYSRSRDCDAPTMPYTTINKRGLERFVLLWLIERPRLSLTERSEVSSVSARMVIEGNLELKRERLNVLLELDTAGLKKARTAMLETEREIVELETELKALTDAPPMGDIEQANIDYIVELDALMRAGVEDVTDLRRALRSTLQQVIRRIDFMDDQEEREDGFWRRVRVTLKEGGPPHDVWYPLPSWGINDTRRRNGAHKGAPKVEKTD